MKTIDKFGSWILDTKAGLIFGLLVIITGASIVSYKALTGPKSVTKRLPSSLASMLNPLAYRRVARLMRGCGDDQGSSHGNRQSHRRSALDG